MFRKTLCSLALTAAVAAASALLLAPPAARAADKPADTTDKPATTTDKPAQTGHETHHKGGFIHFVHQAGKGGKMEVMLGEVAQKNASSPDVKAFGQRMVEDHTKANMELEALAKTKNIEMIPASAKEKEMMTHLESLHGTEFDKAYVKHMLSDHKKDVKEFEYEAESGKDPEVKAFAAKYLPILREHLKMVEELAAKMEKA